MSIEAMKQALEVLEMLARYENPETRIQVRKPKDGGPIVTIYPHKVASDAATALRAAIEQAADPTVWYHSVSGRVRFDGAGLGRNWVPLYTAPRAAIEQAQKQEPVAWMYDFLNSENRNEVIRNWVTQSQEDITRENGFNVRPLYAAPRRWVGLTDEEVHEGFCHVEYETPNDWNTDPDDWCQQFARYLEAKLKEKNT
jgi:hypothetical protein